VQARYELNFASSRSSISAYLSFMLKLKLLTLLTFASVHENVGERNMFLEHAFFID